jgi:hypothetical protein
MTGFDGADTGPAPTLFIAATVNVYAVPVVSPLTRAAGQVAGGRRAASAGRRGHGIAADPAAAIE